ncbi:hypothetical protein ACH5RR_021026 [Cinchona calisaya]|uniref:RNase H type-1 domain-containing protein n=1 Tax=Cinchona calisaya TaxID=153742 RepID=A0ABD2ZJ31_9GENT
MIGNSITTIRSERSKVGLDEVARKVERSLVAVWAGTLTQRSEASQMEAEAIRLALLKAKAKHWQDILSDAKTVVDSIISLGVNISL